SLFVNETQTDYVTLLPNGGALHHLRISVTYNKQGRDIFNPPGAGGHYYDDYSDVQRTYLPADATILGYAGYSPPRFTGFGPDSCKPPSSAGVADCAEDKSHILSDPVLASDVPGRSMVMGAVFLRCGFTPESLDINLNTEHAQCSQHDSPPHTQIIYLEWYTPHAFTRDANGHGTYTMTVEKQPGAVNHVTVYIDNQINAKNPNTGPTQIADEATYTQLIGNKKPVVNNQLIEANTAVTFGF
ncbi:MAG: hypothetical protein ACXWP6_21115, partial [Ktedonobacterales bacterium]